MWYYDKVLVVEDLRASRNIALWRANQPPVELVVDDLAKKRCTIHIRS